MFSFFVLFSLLLAFISLFCAFRVLRQLGWLFGFLRGSAGLLLIVCGCFLLLAAADLSSYKKIRSEKPLLTISFTQKGEQLYSADLVYIEQAEKHSFDIRGEQWQIDARIIRWVGIFQRFGAKPSYRLDRLAGRYYSLEDERRKERSVHQLAQSEFGLDMWMWSHQNGGFLSIIDAVYGSATYLPMEDGAIFQVSLSATGLTAKPLNDIAEKAVSRWM